MPLLMQTPRPDAPNVEALDLWQYPDGVPLVAAFSVVIPALCLGKIPHEVKLQDSPMRGQTWIVREQGTLAGKGLLVDQGPVGLGDLWTEVFNFTNSQIRIRKGESISRIICW